MERIERGEFELKRQAQVDESISLKAQKLEEEYLKQGHSDLTNFSLKDVTVAKE